VLVLLLAITSTANAAQEKNFRVFDCTTYPHKPDLTRFGVETIRIIYGNEMFGIPLETYFKRFGIGQKPDTLPSANWLSKLGNIYQTEPLVVLDYEGLKAYDVAKDKYRNDIGEYVWIVQQFKAGKRQKGSMVGYYGVPPIADLGRVVYGKPTSSLRADNDILKPLVDTVDVLFPSLYTRDPDPNDWLNIAAGTLAEARRISQGKPIFAFIWPRYHEMNKVLGGKPIPSKLWRQQLEYLYENADGIVIWDGNQNLWNEDWPWWQETKVFLRLIGKY
jgi:hypothetical protein